jgi:hypothetical protein
MMGIGLIINSFFFLMKNHWKKYRIGILVFAFGFMMAVLLPRQLTIWIALGPQESEFTALDVDNSSDVSIQLELFENKKFLSTSTNFHRTEENIGTYTKRDALLHLTFHNKKSKLIGTKFKVQNDTLYCIDCSSVTTLVKDD